MKRLHPAVLILFVIGRASRSAGGRYRPRTQSASPAGSVAEATTPTPTEGSSGDTVEAAEESGPPEIVDVMAQMTAAAEQPPADQANAGATVSEGTTDETAAGRGSRSDGRAIGSRN